MSRRSNTRLERRDERAARRPGNSQRPPRPRSAKVAANGPGAGLPWVPIGIGLGVFALVAVLIYAVTQSDNISSGPSAAEKAELDDSTDIAGVYYAPHPGADGQYGTSDDAAHFAPGIVTPICSDAQLESGNVSSPLCYTSNPPTSGPHSSTPQGFGNLENPAPKENVLHSMEHGGVFIWYNTTDEAAIDLLKDVVNDNRDRRRFVGSTIYTDMEPNTIAITSWTRLDKFPVSELTKQRLQTFIDDNHKRYNPEGF